MVKPAVSQESASPSAGSAPEPPSHKKFRTGCGILTWTGLGLLILLCIWSASQPYSRIVENPKRTAARVLGKGIADAVTQFYQEYGRWPLPPGQTAGSMDLSIDTSEKSGLIRILLGAESDASAKRNTGNFNFLEDMKIAKRGQVENGPKWLGGVVMDAGEFAVVDSWGNFYQVRLDTSGDGEIENPDEEQRLDGQLTVKTRVLVWSAGKDRKEETWEDNPRSWD